MKITNPCQDHAGHDDAKRRCNPEDDYWLTGFTHDLPAHLRNCAQPDDADCTYDHEKRECQFGHGRSIQDYRPVPGHETASRKGREREAKSVKCGYTRECEGDEAGSRQGAVCLLYTSPSPRDGLLSRMPSSA